MSWVLVLVAIIVIGGIALALVGRLGEDDLYLPDADPQLRPATDAHGDTQFDVVVRGYRMDEVDARIADLEAQVAALRAEPASEIRES